MPGVPPERMSTDVEQRKTPRCGQRVFIANDRESTGTARFSPELRNSQPRCRTTKNRTHWSYQNLRFLGDCAGRWRVDSAAIGLARSDRAYFESHALSPAPSPSTPRSVSCRPNHTASVTLTTTRPIASHFHRPAKFLRGTFAQGCENGCGTASATTTITVGGGPMLTISKLTRWSINYYIDTAQAAEYAARDRARAGWRFGGVLLLRTRYPHPNMAPRRRHPRNRRLGRA